ncbi:hypothetical protein IC007_0529 [Sulfuracidifex tepidarius]|uniref:Uncharacterized protein n=1 Tax=Sulfuracidifex tepidarius TaxID=1294262 RepID=A0A510E0L2_9CREN|nr:hypothetical protein IC007_0529 [Sulfuracidifex tepidarius]
MKRPTKHIYPLFLKIKKESFTTFTFVLKSMDTVIKREV